MSGRSLNENSAIFEYKTVVKGTTGTEGMGGSGVGIIGKMEGKGDAGLTG